MDKQKDKKNCKGFDEVVEMIAGKWKLKIIRQLIYTDKIRFNELMRQIEGITQTMLTKQLRELETDGLVKRKVYAEVPPRVEYSSTKATKNLKPMFEAMYSWANKNLV